eukprot:561165-Hanusia_phi.AAC.7
MPFLNMAEVTSYVETAVKKEVKDLTCKDGDNSHVTSTSKSKKRRMQERMWKEKEGRGGEKEKEGRKGEKKEKDSRGRG